MMPTHRSPFNYTHVGKTHNIKSKYKVRLDDDE